MSSPVTPLCRILAQRSVRYLLIGVSGANLYTPVPGTTFVTQDYDLFLPPDPGNLERAWAACEKCSLDLWLGGEPLGRPRDTWLAEQMVARRALTRVTGPNDLQVDLTLVMKGFEFEAVWREHRPFVVDGVAIPTARLLHIVQSKHAADRDKDRLFLATHKDALEQLLKKPELD